MPGMIRRTLLVTFIIGSLIWSGTAFSDWEFAHWGATPIEVTKASGNRVQAYDESQYRNKSTFQGSTCKLYMKDYRTSDFVFEVRFCFDSQDHLSSVALYSAADQFPAMDRALRSSFGAPVSEEGGDLRNGSGMTARKETPLRRSA